MISKINIERYPPDRDKNVNGRGRCLYDRAVELGTFRNRKRSEQDEPIRVIWETDAAETLYKLS